MFLIAAVALAIVISPRHSTAQTAATPAEAAQKGVADHRTIFIVHSVPLKPVAEQWAAYRSSAEGGSWRTVLHEAVPPTADSAVQREEVKQAIRRAFDAAHPNNPDHFAVLILGDADDAGIATWHFSQPDSSMKSGDGTSDQFATDHPYQLLKDDDFAPSFALGRVPARSVEEGLAALEKIKQYERPRNAAELAASGRNRIVYAAGEGRFGVMDGVLESLFTTMVDRMVPGAFDLSMTYAKASSIYCPPPSRLTDTILERMSEGALLFNYIGHGFAHGFDSLHWGKKRYRILRTADLKRLPEAPSGQLPIAFLTCCSAGWYDLPEGERSLAEAMFFHPSGPIAVIAGSRITHPYANAILQKDVTKSLLVDRAATVGLLDLHATQALLKYDLADRQIDLIAKPIARADKWETNLIGLRQMHVKLYNLLGDPATRIALPASEISNLKLSNGTVTGDIPNMKTGRVYITLETARASMANPEKIMALVGDDDSELESKAINNYALVNDRVLARFEADVVDGRFEIAPNTDAAPPANAAILRAYAVGVDMNGRTIDGAGAIRIPPPVMTQNAARDAPSVP